MKLIFVRSRIFSHWFQVASNCHRKRCTPHEWHRQNTVLDVTGVKLGPFRNASHGGGLGLELGLLGIQSLVRRIGLS